MNHSQSPSTNQFWKPDLLGKDYEFHTIELGADPDHETDVVATLVRYNPDSSSKESFGSRPALMWVHGMTDYFFHTEFAEFFHKVGFAVYAVDLRKCGRSYRPGQQWHYTSDLAHYFPDLTASTEIISKNHPQLIPVAHSTGGLIVPLWMSEMRRSNPKVVQKIPALVLNSPWLDMMYPPLFIKLITPGVKVLGKRLPKMLIPGGGLGTYGKSIHKDFYGEWNFNTELKPVEGHRKSIGWLRAIMAGQKDVHNDRVNVGVDVLALCSEKSWLKSEYSEETDISDAVLDVQHIQKWAPHLSNPSSKVTVSTIPGARHDVFLSKKPTRDQAFSILKNWLDSRVQDLAPGGK